MVENPGERNTGHHRRQLDTRAVMNIIQMINVQAVLFICLILGFIFGRKGVISDRGRAEMTEVVLNVTLPATILSAFANTRFSPELMHQSLQAFVIAAAVQIASILLGHVCFPMSRFTAKERQILRYSIVNTNATFVGLPVLTGLFGSMGALLCSVATIPLRITLWTAGISLFVEEKDPRAKLRKIALHPSMVAVYIGVFLMLLNALTGLALPSFAAQTLSTVGSGTTFFSMFIVGYIVSRIDFRGMFAPKVIYYTVLRLLVFPLVLLGICRLLGADEMVTAVCVVLTAVPAGSLTAMMAAKYHGDEVLAGRVVLVSTLFSVVTLPLLCLLF